MPTASIIYLFYSGYLQTSGVPHLIHNPSWCRSRKDHLSQQVRDQHPQTDTNEDDAPNHLHRLAEARAQLVTKHQAH